MHNIQQHIAAPENTIVLNTGSDGSNAQIIEAIHAAIPKAIQQSKGAATQFKGKTKRDTFKNIFTYLKTIPYKADGLVFQDIKLPSQFIRLGGDCKSQALFTVSILQNLGIPCILRYAAYDGSTTPSHVYVVAFDGDTPVVIDAVFANKVGGEKRYTYKKDYKMHVRTIAGDPPPSYPVAGHNWLHRRAQAAGKLGQKVIDVVVPDKVKDVIQKVVIDPAKRVGLFIPRTAFLSLVELNFKHFATKINEARQKNGAKNVKRIWETMGGKWWQLIKSVDIGKNKKGLFGQQDIQTFGRQLEANFLQKGGDLRETFTIFNPRYNYDQQPIGEPATAATVATIVGAATPLIIMTIKALKKDGISIDEAGKMVDEASKQYKNYTGKSPQDELFGSEPNEYYTANKKNINQIKREWETPRQAPPSSNPPPNNFPEPRYPPNTQTPPQYNPNNDRPTPQYTPQREAVDTGEKKNTNTTLLVGVAAVAAIFLLKK